MKISSRLIDSGYWFGWNVIWLLPESISRLLFKSIGFFLWFSNAKSVNQLKLNLGRVLNTDPNSRQISRLSRLGLQSYMRYYCETFLLPKWSDAKIAKMVRPVNVAGVESALKQGGVILTLPHSGNWDLAGAWAARYFGSLCTVAERLRPEGVFQKFLKMRTGRGMTLMPLRGEGGTYEFLKDNLVSGKVIALMGDRDVAGNGMSNNFFGHRATLPIGAAALAIDTGLPVFSCATWYDGKYLVIDFDNEVIFDSQPVTGRERLKKAQEVSGLIAQRFEKHILANPQDWHQLQPVWHDLKVGQL